jgi:anti-sigma regulatory factor (Ser/Thr protein kinase)
MRFRIPIRENSELIAAERLLEFCNRNKIPENIFNRLKVSTIEACLNAIEHSESSTGEVEVSFQLERNRIQIKVKDWGKGLYNEYMIKSRDDYRGWGFRIIHHFMDEVQILPQKKGTLIKMTKYIKQGGEDE